VADTSNSMVTFLNEFVVINSHVGWVKRSEPNE